jgi:hypothetical protein
MPKEVTHQEIYDRLVAVEAKVDSLDKNTQTVVAAFDAARGAFVALEFLAKVAKPLLWILGLGAALVTVWQNWRAS